MGMSSTGGIHDGRYGQAKEKLASITENRAGRHEGEAREYGRADPYTSAIRKDLKEETAYRSKKLEELRVKGEKLRLQEQDLQSRLRENELSTKNLDERLSLYDMEKRDFSSMKERHHARKEELESLLAQIGAGHCSTGWKN